MVGFDLTEEQSAIRRLARDFAREYILPWSGSSDRHPEPGRNFNWDIVRKGSELGFRTLSVPKRLGGGGADILTLCTVAEEFAWADSGICVAFDQCWKFAYILAECVSEDQRSRWLPRFMDDPECLLAIGITEPDHGSDSFGVVYGPGIGVQLDARRDGADWLLNGTKCFIANGSIAKIYFIIARTDHAAGIDKGCTSFIVGRDNPGFRFGRFFDKMGNRGEVNAELIFENCRVPDRDRATPEGRGLMFQTEMAKAGHVEAASISLGIARRAYEESLEYARNRVQGGKPIIEHQAVQLMLADMNMLIEAARNYIWRAAVKNQYEEPFEPHYSMLCKVFASEAAFRVCTLGMEIWGGMGYMREAPMEKLLRDAAGYLHSDGANQVHRIKSAQLFAGLGPAH